MTNKRYPKLLLITAVVALFIFALLSYASEIPDEDNSNVDVHDPKIKQATIATKTAITLVWEPASNVNGYKIYRSSVSESAESNNNTGEKLIATIKGSRSKTYTDTKLRYGKTYIYTIKSYKKVAGKIHTSEGVTIKKELKVKSKYFKKYKYFYDMEGHRLTNVDTFLKNRTKYLVKVNILKNVVTVYAKDGKKGFTIPVKAYLCSGNTYDRSGTWHLGEKYRFRTLFYNSFSQWAMTIHGDILFHTVPYKRSANPNSLDVQEYNKLGTSASHGCIRMQCAGVKWLYDHCNHSTKIVFYKSSYPGPLGKPKLEKIPRWHTWDPTDPTMQWKCRKKGCNHTRIF